MIDLNRLPPPAPLPGERSAPESGSMGLMSLLIEESMLRSIQKIDEVENPPPDKKKVNVSLRIAIGVADHFRLRVAEWFTAALLVQFGWILFGPESIFPNQPSLSVMAQWASEENWGIACLIVGGIHLLALTVNGTFPSFRFSPHVRAISSFLACFLWFQVTLSIYLSGIGGTGFGTYRLVLLLELWNFLRSCQDVGKVEARRASNGN